MTPRNVRGDPDLAGLDAAFHQGPLDLVPPTAEDPAPATTSGTTPPGGPAVSPASVSAAGSDSPLADYLRDLQQEFRDEEDEGKLDL